MTNILLFVICWIRDNGKYCFKIRYVQVKIGIMWSSSGSKEVRQNVTPAATMAETVSQPENRMVVK